MMMKHFGYGLLAVVVGGFVAIAFWNRVRVRVPAVNSALGF